MRTVHKFWLAVTDDQIVMMPRGSAVLTVQEQGGRLAMWAIVNTEAPHAAHRIAVVGTGNPMPVDLHRGNYIGSVQQHGGALVWHIFCLEREAKA